jgi:hypothetical protein
MQQQDGLEFMRFFPNTLNANTIADPRVGLGDFNSLAPGGVDPGNTFEINTTLANATSNSNFVPGSWAGSTGASGLRFRDLTSTSTPVPTGTLSGVNNSLVLTVDKNGDVVLTTAGSGTVAGNNGVASNSGTVQLGGACTNTAQIAASQFSSSRAIDLNTFTMEFRNGRVGIGTTTCSVNNSRQADLFPVIISFSLICITPSTMGNTGLKKLIASHNAWIF